MIDADYKHTDRVFKCFRIKNLSEYHDLYVLSDIHYFVNWFM